MFKKYSQKIEDFIHNNSNNKRLLLTLSSTILLIILLFMIISTNTSTSRLLNSYGNKGNGDKLIEYIEKNKNKEENLESVCLAVDEILSNNIEIGANYLITQLELTSNPAYLKKCIADKIVEYKKTNYNLDTLCTLLITSKIVNQNSDISTVDKDEIFSSTFWATIESKIKEFSSEEIENIFAIKISAYITEDKILEGINILDYYFKNNYGVINIYNNLDISLDKLNYYYAENSLKASEEIIISNIISKRTKIDIEVSFINIIKTMYLENFDRNLDKIAKLSNFYNQYNFTENEDIQKLISSAREIRNNNSSIDNLLVALSPIEDDIANIDKPLQEILLSLNEIETSNDLLLKSKNDKTSALNEKTNYEAIEVYPEEKLDTNKYITSLPFNTFLGKFVSKKNAIIYLTRSSFELDKWQKIDAYYTGTEESTVKGYFSSSKKELTVYTEVSDEDYRLIDTLTKEIEDINISLSSTQDELTKTKDEINTLETQISTLETQRLEIQEEIENLTKTNNEKKELIKNILKI
ncbi:coiled-coil domain-containing protein [Clostridium sp. DL1XJH146]